MECPDIIKKKNEKGIYTEETDNMICGTLPLKEKVWYASDNNKMIESLSDKSFNSSHGPEGFRRVYPEEDVKQSIKKLKRKLCVCNKKRGYVCTICKSFKEEFGEELI